jgi:hypothetical protein
MLNNPLLQAGRVVYYPIDFGNPTGISPHHIVLAGQTGIHFRYFIIKTEPSPWQKRHLESLKHFVDIDKKNHPFLDYNSVVYCGELHSERMFNISQQVKEKRAKIRTIISDDVRARILKIMRDKSLKMLSDEERDAVIKYLGAI